MAPVSFKELAEEVWCSGVYLGQFCEHQDFVISDPLDFMKKLTTIWRAETSREDSPVDITRARHILGLAQESVTITETALRASFKKKARALVQPDLAVVNYNDRLEELQEAYRVLTCPRATLLSAGHDPVNLLLILHSLIVMCNRYPEELSSYEFDSYDLLLPLLASHCSAEGVYPEGTTKAQALEISVCAAELVYNTCAVSVINGNVLMDQPDLNVLEKVVNFCVDSMVGGEAADHPELQETCFFVLQTITGLLASSRGRVWIASSSTLVVDLVRVLWLWNQADEKSFFLSKIAQQALEGISRMAQVEKNQERLVQAGILYQLFALLSTYEVELDDITVHNRLQNNISSMDENFADVAVEVQNLLAIMAVRALCRLGGLFPEGSELQSPHNALVKRVADALMTPNLSGLLLLGSHHEFLKIFHGECESYTLFWNAEMRQEQATFVSSRSSVEPTMSTVERYVEAVEFRYMYLADLFAIGGLYIEILMGSLLVIEKNLIPAHVSELGLTEAFFHELFSFIDSGELICPEYVDESGNLQKLPPYAGWNIDKEQLATMDRVTALNCLSITASVAPTLVEENLVANDSAMKMVLRLLFPPDNEVHQSEDAEKSLVLTPQLYVPCRLHCLATLRVLSTLDSFGKASLEFGICDILIELVHICQDVGPQVLEIIRNLCAYGAAADCVAEILQSGCYLEFIGWVLLVEETIVDDEFDAAESLRIPSAMILSEMVKNGAPLNIESRRALCRFFPPAIVRSIASTPETIVEYIMADHMTPELVWNVEFRNHQRNSVVNFLNIYFSASSTTETEDGKFTSVVDSFEIDYTGLYPAPMTGNVYLTLFMEDPTFNLHDSLYFLTCLWSEFEVLFRQLAHMTSALRATMARADDELIQRDIDLIDLVGSSLVCLLQVDTKLLDNVAEMQIPSKCCDFLNETVRSQACEPCVVNVARVLRVCSISRACIESLQPMCSTALSCLMALTNPIRGGPLHFESAYVMEIMRRIVLQYPEHGDRDASVGIVYLASRLDLFGFLLNILDNPDGIGKVKEPHILRAEAIEILNMLEKDRIQGNTAHQLLKKHKKWQKIYRHEATDVVMSMSTEDPFLQRLYPEADRVMREYVRMNPRNSTIV
ncbi:DnaJ sub C member 13 [Phytophthora boehmeriae]|uniref:DnaJ sub C member 13 n=1 Tax=Phytophthora boehmeriae TaxID=109152 RepID=A0A8T1WP84_9STRA|nr:DnaJ sub C member 13 [Phytophthora boehmeriae]